MVAPPGLRNNTNLNSCLNVLEIIMGPVNGGAEGAMAPHFFTKKSYFENFQLLLRELF